MISQYVVKRLEDMGFDVERMKKKLKILGQYEEETQKEAIDAAIEVYIKALDEGKRISVLLFAIAVAEKIQKRKKEKIQRPSLPKVEIKTEIPEKKKKLLNFVKRIREEKIGIVVIDKKVCELFEVKRADVYRFFEHKSYIEFKVYEYEDVIYPCCKVSNGIVENMIIVHHIVLGNEGKIKVETTVENIYNFLKKEFSLQT